MGPWDARGHLAAPSLSPSHPRASDLSSSLDVGAPLVPPASAPAPQGMPDGRREKSPARGIQTRQRSGAPSVRLRAEATSHRVPRTALGSQSGEQCPGRVVAGA